ncbi:MAG: hypothetical protein ACU0BS_12895 [Hasllibacter sp.]
MRMTALAMLGAALLAGCGGGRDNLSTRGAYVPSASGPISRACLASDRRGANPVLCGCIQAVADRSLSGGQQRRGARWFSDPHEAQETRQSDRARDEVLWTAWKAFAENAERTCG